MLYCQKCKIKIGGDKEFCPLCKSEFPKNSEAGEDAFPVVMPEKFTRGLALKIASFFAITAIIICFAVNVAFVRDSWWSLPVAAGIGTFWILAVIGITQHRHFFYSIVVELVLLCGGGVLWDLSIGWEGWSLDFVMPCMCITAMGLMLIYSLVMKIPTYEYIMYLALSAVCGIVPVIFVFTGALSVTFPSVICVSCSLILIAALLIFQGKKMLYEVNKKFHI